MPPALDPAFDQLSTPLLAVSAAGVVEAGNAASGQWFGVSLRRLTGVPLAALEVQGDALDATLGSEAGGPVDGQPAVAGPGAPLIAGGAGMVRLPRHALAYPGAAPRFEEDWLPARDRGGWLLELHPV